MAKTLTTSRVLLGAIAAFSGVTFMAPAPAEAAVVYCKPGVVIAGCVARPARRAVVAAPGAPVARAAVAPGVRRPANVNGGVNRVGRF